MNAVRAATWRPWLLVSAAAAVGVAAGAMAWRMAQSARLLRASQPYESDPPDPVAAVLVVGDSTGVGTGASLPERSVAGMLGTAQPRLRVVNRARNGARWRDFAEQIAAEPGRFDLILIVGGGNDVIRGTARRRLRAHVLSAARLARERSDRVILLPPGNLGNAAFFDPPLSAWMAHRSRRLHAVVREAAEVTGARYVDLYRPGDTDPFALRPRELLAADGLHPSDAGYRVWMRELRAQADVERWAAAHAR